jgi:type II secretory pathway predicted ATPase ExeA
MQGKWVMYESYFGFSQRPFASVARVDQYFPAAAIESARVTLARCIERGEGAGMVVGPSGTGKTLLCQVLAEQFKQSLQVALLSSGRLGTRRALLQAIRYELKQPYRDMDEGELRLALVDHLTLSEDCPNGILLLIDEAQTLPLRLLDELRMLTNLTHRGQPRVRLVLAGGCALEERLASPKLDSFSQRLVARCYLESFSRAETQDYIHARIHAVGGQGETIFSETTCQSVHRATDGVPRLINQVCDHALVLAFVGGRRWLEPAQIEEAWADLQQLPTPWNAECRSAAPGGGVVEFGSLDDSPAELASAPDAAAAGAASSAETALAPPQSYPQADGSSAADLEPTAQLQHIEQLLAAAEEDFRPAGSIGPEVELIFDEIGHPFAEEFEEEEIITDRYAAAGKVSDPPLPGGAERSAWESARQRKPEAAEAQPAAALCEARPETVPLCPLQPVADLEPDDEDLLIVEDDERDADGSLESSITAVRRQEFSRLFANLRRR